MKTIGQALVDMLDDLSQPQFEKFCSQLQDRQKEPRVRRNSVEGKSRLEIADLMISTFTQSKASKVALQILRQISCNQAALGEIY
ncbi:hypothetical protein LDENG_00048050 [Lucifuga dentata]|nr:hypothetical protein LDENG_00048050 [Lucifuga dentata]